MGTGLCDGGLFAPNLPQSRALYLISDSFSSCRVPLGSGQRGGGKKKGKEKKGRARQVVRRAESIYTKLVKPT